MIHSVRIRKASPVLGSLPVDHQILIRSRLGWADLREASGKVFRILKRENPDENPMCWEVVAIDEQPLKPEV